MATKSFPDPSKALDLDKLLEQNPSIGRARISKVRALIKARRQDGHRTSYRLDSPYERGRYASLRRDDST